MKGINKSEATRPDKYDKIFYMEYPRPEIDADFPDPVLRAAQFAPFEALNGHEDAIDETARETDKRRIPDEYSADELERKLSFLLNFRDFAPVISVTYFISDKKKSGGKYVTVTDVFEKISEYKKLLILKNGTEIPTVDILKLESDIFDIYN